MPWTRIDDGWATNRKIQRAGLEAAGFWVACCCYCNRHLTDGRIEVEDMSLVAPGLDRRKVRRICGVLLAEALLLDRGSYYEINDFLEYNDSRAMVLEKRRKAAAKKRRQRGVSPGDMGGDGTGDSRAHGSRPDPTRPDPTQGLSQVSSQTGAGGADAPPLELALDEPPAKRSKRAKPPTVTGETWLAYSAAYELRYGMPPIRNARVSGQLASFVRLVGEQEAPAIAGFYVGHNGRWYVQKGHPIGALLNDAEKLRTEWATGRKITSADAQECEAVDNLRARAEHAEGWQEYFSAEKRKGAGTE